MTFELLEKIYLPLQNNYLPPLYLLPSKSYRFTCYLDVKSAKKRGRGKKKPRKWCALRFWMRTALSVYVRFFFLFSFNWEGGIHIIYLGLCVLQNSSHFLVIRRLLDSLWICFRNKPYYCLDKNGFISTSQVYSNAHTVDFFWKIFKTTRLI